MVKNPPAIREMQETLEEEMATHSSILAWRIPWTKEPGSLSQRVGHVQHHETCWNILQQSQETLDNGHEPRGWREPLRGTHEAASFDVKILV